MKCECGGEITEEELETQWNKGYKIKMCTKCMANFSEHAITGD